jgi:multidrug efflux pump subunit AcrA (membrane-fusion protein)
VLLSILAAGCSGDDNEGVRVAAVGRSTVTEVVEAPANVVAKATATVNSPADGRVSQLLVADGQAVRAGQVLLRLDSPAAEDQLREARKADAEAASAGQVAAPGVDFSRSQRQADRAADRAFASARTAAAQIPDATAQKQALAQVAQAEAQYAAARADARATVRRFNAGLASLGEALSSLGQAQRVQTRAAVAAAQRTVDALVVRAPIAGTVSLGSGSGGGGSASDLSSLVDQLPAEAQGQASQLLGGAGDSGSAGGGTGGSTQTVISAGAPVSRGGPLVTVTDASALSLTATVDETDVLLVRKGVTADVELDAVPGASYAATVTSINPAPITSNRGGVSFQVRLTLGGGSTQDGEPAPRPRPGMSAVADLEVRTAAGAVSVPVSAIVRDGSRDTVWAVENGKARRRPVNLGAQGENDVQIVSGLQEGQRVVVRGADRVREGQQVES